MHHGRLGAYPAGHFSNDRVQAALARFQQSLAEVESHIVAANASRPLDYPYLIPSQIPQSINI